jgi:anaerobic selenocysteine-containing dehydrogenase
MFGWHPSHWAGIIPNGLGQVKPNHYLDILKTVWANRRELPYAMRILRKGVCDGCALGTTGMRDFTMKGIHLCTVRLNLLRLNTMAALNPAALSDVASLREKSSAELRELGRLPYPMVRRKGEPGFRRTTWDQALDLIAGRIRQSSQRRPRLSLAQYNRHETHDRCWRLHLLLQGLARHRPPYPHRQRRRQ